MCVAIYNKNSSYLMSYINYFINTREQHFIPVRDWRNGLWRNGLSIPNR